MGRFYCMWPPAQVLDQEKSLLIKRLSLDLVDNLDRGEAPIPAECSAFLPARTEKNSQPHQRKVGEKHPKRTVDYTGRDNERPGKEPDDVD